MFVCCVNSDGEDVLICELSLQKNKASEDNNGHKDDESANRLYGNNEDEDESEDEDGDLSKYDLWGSDEDKDKKKPDKHSDKG